MTMHTAWSARDTSSSIRVLPEFPAYLPRPGSITILDRKQKNTSDHRFPGLTEFSGHSYPTSHIAGSFRYRVVHLIPIYKIDSRTAHF